MAKHDGLLKAIDAYNEKTFGSKHPGMESKPVSDWGDLAKKMMVVSTSRHADSFFDKCLTKPEISTSVRAGTIGTTSLETIRAATEKLSGISTHDDVVDAEIYRSMAEHAMPKVESSKPIPASADDPSWGSW